MVPHKYFQTCSYANTSSAAGGGGGVYRRENENVSMGCLDLVRFLLEQNKQNFVKSKKVCVVDLKNVLVIL